MPDPRHGNRWHGDVQAVRAMDLDIHRGEAVGIVGRNGSGKSTFLQLICGTLAPSTGEITVNRRIAALLELGSGVNPEFSGRENAYLYGTVLGLARAHIEARFADIAAFPGIGEFMDQPVQTYSSGMFVRLACAVAINATPEILVVDGAMALGAEAFQGKCFARTHTLRDPTAHVPIVSNSDRTIGRASCKD